MLLISACQNSARISLPIVDQVFDGYQRFSQAFSVSDKIDILEKTGLIHYKRGTYSRIILKDLEKDIGNLSLSQLSRINFSCPRGGVYNQKFIDEVSNWLFNATNQKTKYIMYILKQIFRVGQISKESRNQILLQCEEWSTFQNSSILTKVLIKLFSVVELEDKEILFEVIIKSFNKADPDNYTLQSTQGLDDQLLWLYLKSVYPHREDFISNLFTEEQSKIINNKLLSYFQLDRRIHYSFVKVRSMIIQVSKFLEKKKVLLRVFDNLSYHFQTLINFFLTLLLIFRLLSKICCKPWILNTRLIYKFRSLLNSIFIYLKCKININTPLLSIWFLNLLPARLNYFDVPIALKKIYSSPS